VSSMTHLNYRATGMSSLVPGHEPGCACPACQGLTSLVRPRFVAGQVLTEVDLMELERYAVAAHRMHNRYLHGWGIVCGLDLVCEDCGDGAVVRPGYALDPCGRDLVVPTPQHVDVARLIRDCLDAERAKPVCDPPTVGPPKGCDTDDHWCVTLRYREVPVRPVTPLASTGRSQSQCACGCHNGNGNANGKGCGCGCGGAKTVPTAGWSCTCGAGGSRSTQACGCAEYVSAPELPPGCEPTRIVECFEIGVCRCDGACCDLQHALEGTFPVRALECFKAIMPIFDKRLSKKEQTVSLNAALGDVKPSDQYYAQSGICKLYDAILELYERDPLRTTCQLPQEFQEVDCSPQRDQESQEAYSQRLVNAAQVLVLLVVGYLRDCICHALNPPCPDPCDDRVILGCLTWRDGKVVQICNLECRRYAGSFVSRRYWLPIGPVVLWGLGVLCCFPLVGWHRNRDLVNVPRLLRTADPSGNIRNLLAEDDFAMAKSWRSQARDAFSRLKPTTLWPKWSPSDYAVNLAGFEGAHAGEVEHALTDANVQPVLVEVASPDAVPMNRLGVLPVVEPGARVRAFVYRGRVIGFAPAAPEDD
jgi:hypothetical protein